MQVTLTGHERTLEHVSRCGRRPPEVFKSWERGCAVLQNQHCACPVMRPTGRTRARSTALCHPFRYTRARLAELRHCRSRTGRHRIRTLQSCNHPQPWMGHHRSDLFCISNIEPQYNVPSSRRSITSITAPQHNIRHSAATQHNRTALGT